MICFIPGESLLADPRFRLELLNELLELEGFLMQRRSELADEDNLAFVQQWQGGAACLQQQSVNLVGE